MTRTFLQFVGCSALTLATVIAAADEAPPSAADLLPPTTAAVLEVPDPEALMTTLLEHPIAKKLQASPQYQQAMQSGQLVPLKAGLAFIEFGMQMESRDILTGVAGDEICLAIDAETQGIALLIRARDAETLSKFRNVLVNLARDTAKREGKEDPIKSIDYRGVSAYQAGEARVAVIDQWMVVTNKDELGKKILDRYLDKTAGGLASSERYQEARAQQAESSVAWGYIDITMIREGIKDQNNPLASGKAEDPAGEILIGGLLANLQQTPYVTAAVELDADRLRIAARAPHDPSWIGEEREYYFGPMGEGRAPQPIDVPQRIAAISAYRDFSGMWLRAGDLFSREINDKFAEADANLSTLFSGRDFGEDILGALQPQVQLVIARQTFDEKSPVPTIKVPAFALVATFKDPESMQRDFRRIFQNLIGFFNVVGAMNGQPQLDIEMQEHAGGSLIATSYAPPAEPRPGSDTQIHYNFSPTISFIGPRVIISSTTPLACLIIEKLGQQQDSPAMSEANTLVELDAQPLRDVLQDNFGQLVAQNVLEKGHSREQAEQETQAVLDILKLFSGLQLRLDARDQLTIAAELRFAKD